MPEVSGFSKFVTIFPLSIYTFLIRFKKVKNGDMLLEISYWFYRDFGEFVLIWAAKPCKSICLLLYWIGGLTNLSFVQKIRFSLMNNVLLYDSQVR